MKKAKLIALLSVSMILAACGGKKDNSSANVDSSSAIESSETISSLTSNSESQSSQVIDPASMSEEEAYNALEENLKDLAMFCDRKTIKEESFTENAVMNYSTLKEVKKYGINQDRPFEVSRDRNGETNWYTMSYDATNKVGYSIEEDDRSGTRELDEINWVSKKGNDYLAYESYFGEYYHVDGEYAWNRLFSNSVIDEMRYVGAYLSLKSEVIYYVNSFAVAHDPSASGLDVYGEALIETKYIVSKTKEGNNSKLIFNVKSSVNYQPVEAVPEVITQSYLLDDNSYIDLCFEYVYNDNNLVSVEFSYDSCDSTNVLLPEGRIESSTAYVSHSKSNITNKYTEYKDYPDVSEYTDEGYPYSRIYIDVPYYGSVGGYGGRMGETCTIDTNYILTSYQQSKGVTFELYEDRDYTKKINGLSLKYKSYETHIYVKYNVPEDVTLAFYTKDYVWAENYDSKLLSFSRTDQYEGEPVNGFRPAYDVVLDEYNPSIDDYVASATFAASSVSVDYSTDENPTINGSKIDLKGGNFYVLSFIYDQIA